MRLGLVGFPQTGRTTLFSALTGRSADDQRPGRAHIASLAVPDARLDRLVAIYASRKRVPASIEIEDLPAISPPGRAPGPAAGQAFSDMRACDALVFVIRAFENDLVPHHRDRPDPKQDLADLEAELVLADLDVCSRRIARLEKDIHKPLPNQADLKAELAVLERCAAALEAGDRIDTLNLHGADERVTRSIQFLSARPRVVVFNVGEAAAREPDPDLAAVPGSKQICAALERDLAELDEADRGDFMAEYRLDELAGPRVVRLAYDVLHAVTFYTAAENEARAWILTRGEDAVAAAGKIHTDLASGFIRAEVVAFEHLDAAGSVREAKAQGHVRTEGRDYVVKDGDVLFILFSK